LRSVVAEPELPLSRVNQALADVERQWREAEQESFRETSLRKLKGARRKTVLASVDEEPQ
jgi:hypothetical protein